MLSLTFGLCAALAWGIHDICVRYVSQQGGIMPSLTTVLVAGSFVLVPVVFLTGGWQAMTPLSFGYAALSGLCYVFGCIGLYKSFAIGPVRLVAPIMGAYPILSIAWSAAQGQVVPADQWLAVGAIIAGVALVSILSDQEDSNGSQMTAIAWAIVGSVGFALTFAIGQLAAQAGAEMPVIFVTRVVTATLAAVILVSSSGPKRPPRSAWPLLAMMGLLDAFALGIVIASAGLERPEFAAVAASTFGMITIILAWGFLKERMTLPQWSGVALTFGGIGYLAL